MLSATVTAIIIVPHLAATSGSKDIFRDPNKHSEKSKLLNYEHLYLHVDFYSIYNFNFR